jgi:hypothetical protein
VRNVGLLAVFAGQSITPGRIFFDPESIPTAFTDEDQISITSDRLTVLPQPGDTSGIAEAFRDIWQFGCTKLAGNKLADILLLVRMLFEVLPIGFDQWFGIAA